MTDRHPFFDANSYPWHRAEAGPAHEALFKAIKTEARIDLLYNKCKDELPPLSHGAADVVWKAALEQLTTARALETLCKVILADPTLAAIHPEIQAIVDAKPEPRVDRAIHWARRYGWILALAVVVVGGGGFFALRACTANVTIAVQVHVTAEQGKVLTAPDTIVELEGEHEVRATSIDGDGQSLRITFDVPKSALGKTARLRVIAKDAPIFTQEFEIGKPTTLTAEPPRIIIPRPRRPTVTITKPADDSKVRPNFVIEVRIEPPTAAAEIELTIGDTKIVARVNDGVASRAAPALRPGTYTISATISEGSGKGTRAEKTVTIVLEEAQKPYVACCYLRGSLRTGAACCPQGTTRVIKPKPDSAPDNCRPWVECQ
jgi:hypothetical protein